MIRLLLLLLVLAALPARAEEVVAGLSQTRISIDTNFSGSEIVIFGAVRRETAIDPNTELNIVVTVAGPSSPVAIRKKDRRFGIWVNTEAAEAAEAPTFYAVATSGAWANSVADWEDQQQRISVREAIGALELNSAVETARVDFTDALIRLRENQNLYQTNVGSINFRRETLFDTTIELPANLTEGSYVVRFFLTRDGRIIDAFESDIFVQKVGMERILYNLAHQQPLIYGCLSIAIAIAAGWLASAVFRYMRRA